MKIIAHNPFRLLGVYSNSQERDIVSNVNKAKAYLKVGRSVEFDTDFLSILPSTERTVDQLDRAKAQINQINDRIKYALFWFIKNNSIDEIALGHLKTNNISKAKEIFGKKESFSSLINSGLLLLCEKEWRLAVDKYTKVIHDSKYRNDFLKETCSDNIKISESEFANIFYSALLEEIPAKELLKACSNPSDYDYVRSKAVQIPINRINNSIALTKQSDKSAQGQYNAGIALMNDTKESLKELFVLIGKDEQYQIVVDSLAKQILQCGINYYNSSNELDKAQKALILQDYALSIAIGKLTKDRCQDNVNILKQVVATLPPPELIKDAETIQSKITVFNNSSKSISNVIKLIESCGPHLASIREVQGRQGSFYLRISTRIGDLALNAVIDSVNKAIKGFESKDAFDRLLARTQLTTVLEDAWRATLYMDALDLERQAQNHYDTQRKALENIVDQAGVLTFTIDVDFSIATDSEVFNSCKDLKDYNTYIRRFPNGKHKKAAQKKIEDFERKEQEKKREVLSQIEKLNSFPDAIAFYSKCKESDYRFTLDDKCFALCKSKSNYREYLRVFGSRAKHRLEAENHLKLDKKIQSIKKSIKDYWLGYTLLLALVCIIIGTGLIWGKEGYIVLLRIIGGLCALIAFGGISSKEKEGCILGIVCGIIAFFCFAGSNSLEDSAKETRYKQEEITAYNNVIKNPSLEKCSSFVSRYPSSSYSDEVLKLYYQCAESNGLEGLLELANLRGAGKWRIKADERVAQICDSLYKIADRTNTIEGWRKYQASVPAERYEDSSDRITIIENEAWSTESKAWVQACKEKTINAYQKYLNLYPNGMHKSEANKKVIDLQVANVFAGEHGDLPSMDQTGYGGGSTSSISIYNRTSYNLTLLYSGPDSKRIVISPNQTGYITLRNGSYKIAASVSASNVRNYAGSENLRGGSYSAEYYIVTSRY